MEFIKLTTKQFNYEFNANLDETISFYEATKEIERNHILYFYISMDKNDVIEAIKNEQEVADQLDLYLIYISDLGIYIAIYE